MLLKRDLAVVGCKVEFCLVWLCPAGNRDFGGQSRGSGAEVNIQRNVNCGYNIASEEVLR